MDWVTALWAMLIGGCVAMALPHLMVGIWQRRVAHLCFAVAVPVPITSRTPASNDSEKERFLLPDKAFERKLAFENREARWI
jgi:hypothetical protein